MGDDDDRLMDALVDAIAEFKAAEYDRVEARRIAAFMIAELWDDVEAHDPLDIEFAYLH